jgi:hypothetical protein
MYHEPTDLTKSPLLWTIWPMHDRIAAAKAFVTTGVVGEAAAQAAVALSIVEQPAEFPNGNCIGMMVQGETKPWGWSQRTWNNVQPVGWVNAKEGMTGQLAPFFAFATPHDSLRIAAEKCAGRSIYSGRAYADKWFGAETVTAADNATRNFNAKLAEVLAAW